MGNRGDHRLDNLKPETPPGLEFLAAAHVDWADALDIGSLTSGRRMVLPFEPGGRIKGPRLSGTILPSSMSTLLVRSDGVAEVESHVILEMDDGPLIGYRASGIRWLSAEAAQELAEGGFYDPNQLNSRAFVRFEAANDGPYAWLNRELCIGKAIRTVDAIDSTIWRIL